MMGKPLAGFAFCGSFCTFDQVIEVLRKLAERYDILPLMSPNAAATDTRFGKAAGFVSRIEDICSRQIITSIEGAEPIGPKSLLDILIIAPCTGNTLAKIASGVTDTAVTMAYKAHLRNGKPVLIAVSTNDALSANAANIGLLMNRKNNYFVPFAQDDPHGKPASLVAEFDLIPEAAAAALEGRQLQPLLRSVV